MDIDVESPFPAGFFQSQSCGNDFWVQLTYEMLGEFCYKCGLISHVTGNCKLEKPAMIMNGNGVEARLYRPWLRSENPGSLCFVNPPESEDDRRKMIREKTHMEINCGTITKISSSDKAHSDSLVELEEENLGTSFNRSADMEENFRVAKAIYLELDALSLTFKSFDLITNADLQHIVWERFKSKNFYPSVLALWASNILSYFLASQYCDKQDNGPVDPNFLKQFG